MPIKKASRSDALATRAAGSGLIARSIDMRVIWAHACGGQRACFLLSASFFRYACTFSYTSDARSVGDTLMPYPSPNAHMLSSLPSTTVTSTRTVVGVRYFIAAFEPDFPAGVSVAGASPVLCTPPTSSDRLIAGGVGARGSESRGDGGEVGI